MASRSLSDLHPVVRKMAENHIMELSAMNIDLLIYCTHRSSIEQAALYAQGREILIKVNIYREAAGLPPILELDNERTVTNAKPGLSFHEYGLAYDCVPIICGKPLWNADHGLWTIVGNVGESYGLLWAGNWKGTSHEHPHFQWSGGLPIEEIAKGKEPSLFPQEKPHA